MRNLKRALSLALASTMLLGMMVVGTSAKTIDFTDSSEIANKDAVAVTSAIGIFDGYDNGSFQPTKTVTRAEMAVIVCKMLYGSDVNVAPYAETTVFTDVPAWAAGYVNMAAELGITSGVGDNKFNPNAAVTTAQAALMLSKALGYFNAADETAYAMGWELAAITRGTDIGLFGDMALTSKAGLSRDNVAEMTFNALENATVRYNAPNDMYYNGPSWINGMLPVTNTTSTSASAQHLLGKNFDELTIDGTATDAFKRPSTEYKIDGNVVAVIGKDASVSYTAATKRSTIEKATEENMNNSDNVYLNGVLVTNVNTALFNNTDVKSVDGMIIEAYNDPTSTVGTTYIAYNYFVDEVSRVGENSDDEREITVGGRKFATESFEKDDVVVYTMAHDGSKLVIETVEMAKTVKGELTATATGYIKIDGVKYTKTAATGFTDDSAVLGDTVAVYVDANGYALSMDVVEATEEDMNYLYALAVGTGLEGKQARVVFADGIEKVIEYENTAPTANNLYKYSENDGVYTLTAVATNQANVIEVITQGDYTFSGEKLTNDTVFVDMKSGKTYVGYENVPTYTTMDITNVSGTSPERSLMAKNATSGDVDVVFIVDGVSADSEDQTYFYMVDADAKYETKVDGKKVTVFTNAYVDGVQTDIVVDSNIVTTLTFDVKNDTMYQVKTVNDNDVITAIQTPAGTSISAEDVNMTGKEIFYADVNGTDTKFKVVEDTVFVIIDGRDSDTSIYEGSINDLIVTNFGTSGKDTTSVDVITSTASGSYQEAGLVMVYLTTNA